MCATTPSGRGRSSRASAAVEPRAALQPASARRTRARARSPARRPARRSRRARRARRRAPRARATIGTVAASTGRPDRASASRRRACASEEVEVAEREVPGVAPLRQLGRVVGEPLADEADRARASARSPPRGSVRSSPGLTIATARSASTARTQRAEHASARRRPRRSPPTRSRARRACVTTAQPSPSSIRTYGRGESA